MPAFADSVILPHRVIDTRTHAVIDFEGLLARCSEAKVVTVGENHEDPATHQMELAILEGLYRYHGDLVLSFEMFERDVQPILDQYLAAEVTEDEFLQSSRPWGNYATDYRPMVEFARENSFPVIAANVPRPIAAKVAAAGFEAAQFTEDEMPFMASTYEAPADAYFEAFAATMRMPGMEQMGVTEQSIQLYYEAQVLKDETMAESISRAAMDDPEALVYHVTGAFHTIDMLGTFSRVKRNLPGDDIVSILVVPVDDLLASPPVDTTKADFWILVQAPPPVEEEEMSMEEMMQMMQRQRESEGENGGMPEGMPPEESS
jgi:uncharacterized iron-regulated protein